jgi:hypothetical protein
MGRTDREKGKRERLLTVGREKGRREVVERLEEQRGEKNGMERGDGREGEANTRANTRAKAKWNGEHGD